MENKDIGNTSEKIYQFLIDYTSKNLYPPTIREIGDAVGLSSTSTVSEHLKKLEEAKLIVRPKLNEPRTITLTGYKLEKE